LKCEASGGLRLLQPARAGRKENINASSALDGRGEPESCFAVRSLTSIQRFHIELGGSRLMLNYRLSA
jgi:hypothetical protein